jgi:hypothetical protein
MKKFIINIFLFSLTPITLVCLSDYYLSRKDPFNYKRKYEEAIKQRDSIKIIALGNSHALNAINPKGFNLYTYNLANPNQSLYFDKLITLDLLDKLGNLSYVLISIDFHSLYFSSQGVRDIWSYYGNGIKYKDKSYFFEKISPTLFGYSPKIVLYILKENFLENKKQEENYFRGHESLVGRDLNKFSQSNYVKRAQIFHDKIAKNMKYRDEIVEDLRHFIEILKENNITPILFNSPTYYQFNTELDEGFYKENEKIIDKIASEYNIKYWPFMKSSIFTKAHFYNPDHLNAKGAKRFSEILSDSIDMLNTNRKN